MKIIDKRSPEVIDEGVLSSSIPSGTIFQGKICGHNLKYFLKTYKRVVSLESINTCWEDSIRITGYLPLDCELTIKGIL